jgi:hypothetical protein
MVIFYKFKRVLWRKMQKCLRKMQKGILTRSGRFFFLIIIIIRIERNL